MREPLALKEFLRVLQATDREAAKRMLDEQTRGFPWLASAWADYLALRDCKLAEYLEDKQHPAQKAADTVRQISREKKRLEKLSRVTMYLIEYYETLFPWLSDFKEDHVTELLQELLGRDANQNETADDEQEADRARDFLTAEEYAILPSAEKNQRALDNYWKRRKRAWQVGRDYERYIGYLYERNGFDVYYQGIHKGIEDLGRDLICKKGGHVEIVQCKCWSRTKTIHEKHINQLFGTSVMYYLQTCRGASRQLELFPSFLNDKRIRPCLFTSTTLSETAKLFADALGVAYVERKSLESYPSIKCNVSRVTGEKIYHLPFDQQYDKTLINDELLECYVETVAQAEQLGFRRAFRWKGNE
ncbi:MAG: restriction endonuclease [Verrucomicrobia bacterium]|nr:restriction endonuclease [Verrucomicrobiota bacterium]